MIQVFVSGSRNFKKQIEHFLESQETLFQYCDSVENADVVVSEEDSALPTDKTISYIEIMKNMDHTKFTAFQNICGAGRKTFEIQDISSVLSTTVLMTDLLKKEKEALIKSQTDLNKVRDELEDMRKSQRTASMVQFSMMQDGYENLNKSFESYKVYLPKEVLSGDFFYADEIFDKTFIVFGDATGHGFFPSIYAATVYSLIKEYLNNISRKDADIVKFATAIYEASFVYQDKRTMTKEGNSGGEALACMIDHKLNKLYLVSFGAGGISPFIISSSGKIKQIGEITDEDGTHPDYEMICPKLGDDLIGDFTRHVKVMEEDFFPGDTAFFYTDGLSETFATTEFDQAYTYGSDRIRKALEGVLHENGNDNEPISMVYSVVEDLKGFAPQQLEDKSLTLGNQISDDTLVLCLRRKKESGEADGKTL